MLRSGATLVKGARRVADIRRIPTINNAGRAILGDELMVLAKPIL
jgi:hypothetical protein